MIITMGFIFLNNYNITINDGLQENRGVRRKNY